MWPTLFNPMPFISGVKVCTHWRVLEHGKLHDPRQEKLFATVTFDPRIRNPLQVGRRLSWEPQEWTAGEDPRDRGFSTILIYWRHPIHGVLSLPEIKVFLSFLRFYYVRELLVQRKANDLIFISIHFIMRWVEFFHYTHPKNLEIIKFDSKIWQITGERWRQNFRACVIK